MASSSTGNAPAQPQRVQRRITNPAFDGYRLRFVLLWLARLQAFILLALLITSLFLRALITVGDYSIEIADAELHVFTGAVADAPLVVSPTFAPLVRLSAWPFAIDPLMIAGDATQTTLSLVGIQLALGLTFVVLKRVLRPKHFAAPGTSAWAPFAAYRWRWLPRITATIWFVTLGTFVISGFRTLSADLPFGSVTAAYGGLELSAEPVESFGLGIDRNFGAFLEIAWPRREVTEPTYIFPLWIAVAATFLLHSAVQWHTRPRRSRAVSITDNTDAPSPAAASNSADAR